MRGVGSNRVLILVDRVPQNDNFNNLNFSHKTDAFGIKGLGYLNRAGKTAYQDTANDNYTSAFRDEKFKGTRTWGTDLQGTLISALSWASSVSWD